MNIDDFRHDCERLGKLTNGCVSFIRFMGGEPLLHNQITEFLDIGRNNFPKGDLVIVTNGILLPKQHETFWENCHKNRVDIQISNYPIKIDRDKINSSAKKYNVTVDYVGGEKEINWRAMKLDLNGRQDIKKSFGLCSQSNTCIHLNKGKIYPCPITAYIKYFNKYFGVDFKITDDDYIDIYKAENIDSILDYLCKPIPFCRYCNVKEEKNIEWSMSKKDIEEWI
jgi:MoaA/NifB/PqqE/SkfB family radical SAM enzyme